MLVIIIITVLHVQFLRFPYTFMLVLLSFSIYRSHSSYHSFISFFLISLIIYLPHLCFLTISKIYIPTLNQVSDESPKLRHDQNLHRVAKLSQFSRKCIITCCNNRELCSLHTEKYVYSVCRFTSRDSINEMDI